MTLSSSFRPLWLIALSLVVHVPNSSSAQPPIQLEPPGKEQGPVLLVGFRGSPKTGATPLAVQFQSFFGGAPPSMSWDFGDGNTSNDVNPAHVYNSVGTYTVTLRANRGGIEHEVIKTDYIIATPPPPIAEFSATPLSGQLPLEVTLTDLSTGGPITSRLWDFGDTNTSTAVNPIHTYTQPGEYTVSLTLTGPGGIDSESKVGYVNVMAPVPAISIQVPHRVFVDQNVKVTVTVTEPNNENVTVRCLNPPHGFFFDPVINQPSPVMIETTWDVDDTSAGQIALLFEARNTSFPSERGIGKADVTVLAKARINSHQLRDTDGDAILEVFAGSGRNNSIPSTYVWQGGATIGGTEDAFIEIQRNPIFGDVNGDEVDDIIVPDDSGTAFEVFLGGSPPSGVLVPDATFQIPGGCNRDGFTRAVDFLVADLTGDGIGDFISPSVFSCGFLVWKGATNLSGNIAASATLDNPFTNGGAGDSSIVSSGQEYLLEDFNGDGVLDLIVVNKRGSFGTPEETGSMAIWFGGPGLASSSTADVVLQPGVEADGMGTVSVGVSQAYYLKDVSGDGFLDIIVGCPGADIGGVNNTGAIYVWNGGAGLSGNLPPSAILSIPGAFPDDFLVTNGEHGIQFADVTGDGTLDVISSSTIAGINNQGEGYVWKGGPLLTGSVAPHATLNVPTAMGEDRMGAFIHLGDVSGDGQTDIVLSASVADFGTSENTGAAYVWRGGVTLTGTVSPDATLRVSGAVDEDRLGRSGLFLVEVTGDSTLDVIAASDVVDRGGAVDAGAIYVWAGGVGLMGTPAITATLKLPSPSDLDRLTHRSSESISSSLPRVSFADITGDGQTDIVTVAPNYDLLGTDRGGVFMWAGGAGLSGNSNPTASFVDTTDGFRVGFGSPYINDVTDDGVLDIIMVDQYHNGGRGCVYVWAGGSGAAGTVQPLVALEGDQASVDDQLGFLSNPGFMLGDVSGDGKLDVLAVSPFAFFDGKLQVGAIFYWAGPINASTGAGVRLHASDAAPFDFLGS